MYFVLLLHFSPALSTYWALNYIPVNWLEIKIHTNIRLVTHHLRVSEAGAVHRNFLLGHLSCAEFQTALCTDE